MLKIKRKLINYQPTRAEIEVLDSLGDYIDKECWNSFLHIKKRLNEEIKKLDKLGDQNGSRELNNIRKKLIHQRIKEMKENIKTHYEEELIRQGSEYVCYYCEREKLRDFRGNSLAHIDHILCKLKYPKLTLTSFNLVPVCVICNRNYKSDKDVNLSKDINPDISNLPDLKYSIIHPYLDNKEDFFEVDIEHIWQIKKTINSTLRKKALQTIDMFGLNNIYHVEGKINNPIRKRNEDIIDKFISKDEHSN